MKRNEIQCVDEGFEAIKKNEAWEISVAPLGKRAIGLKWIFKTKYTSNGEVQRHKAHLVAKGYTQEHGVDFDKVFSLVARMEMVRVLFAFEAQQGWLVFHQDVKSVFLNDEVLENVYVRKY